MEKFCPVHSFDVSFEEAKFIQSELRKQVEIFDAISLKDVDLVGGADVAFIETVSETLGETTADTENSSKFPSPGRRSLKTSVTALAGVVTYDVKRACIVETAYATAPVFFPYVPGFLSFREGPAVLAATGELTVLPGVMIYDGCGIAHPRGLGLAAHMAILSGIPSIGCAKSLLCGLCSEPGPQKGNWTEITYKNGIVGNCLRTRDNVRPVYVSPGSRFSIEGARELVLSLAVKYRLPEPTRLAHNLVTAEKKKMLTKYSGRG